MKTKLIFLVIMLCSSNMLWAQHIFPKDAWGVYSWGNYHPKYINKKQAPEIKGAPLILNWRKLEPENGVFKFDEQIGEKLLKLEEENLYTHLMVWVAFSTKRVTESDTTWAFTPKWIFDNGVPLVSFDPRPNPFGETVSYYFPYYLDANYKYYFHRLIHAMGEYVLSLPPHLRKRILFLQSAEGSTGDGQPYKGKPHNSQYKISKEQWSKFRIETWETYVDAFSKEGELQIPILTNYDTNREVEYKWILNHLPKAIGLKNGMFSHGYHISDAQQRLEEFKGFQSKVEEQGKVFFSRGEQDQEYKTYGWSTKNIPQGFYWSALYATHCGLSLWNIPKSACIDEKNFEAFRTFNRYAAQVHPTSADYAFCALRRGLDVSDTNSFPEEIYGKSLKSNQERYIKIAKAFEAFGAHMGDPSKAIKGGMINRKRQDYNDAGWKILKGNYERHLNQINPEETSIAWWNIDKSIYGRFARGFDYKSGKNTMYFDLIDDFFGKNRNSIKNNINLKIIYFSDDGGKWELKYHDVEGNMQTACEVTNIKGQGWQTKNVIINNAALQNGGKHGADFILENKGKTNCRFHMIEVDKSKVEYVEM
ncbi:hypothetical protein MY04_5234 [Flammeovirga sp. MY04]|nr:hypothetical protein [Flammeovirga sp. MY04]ANQ52566.2 hypothetical protein MY04_5234 [Flammeovirga sp. MY04]